MKKILAIPVLIIYLIAISGVMIHAHYCGHELESWTVYTQAKGCTDGACGDESSKNDGCCKDKVFTSKVSQDQNSVAAFQLKPGSPLQGITAPSYITQTSEPVLYRNLKANGNQPNAPPGRRQFIPLYKLHSSFIYYG